MMRTLKELLTLVGRNALLIGGAGHIGLAAGEALVELGASVAVLDQDEDNCCKRVQELSTLASAVVIPVACDLRDEMATRKAVNKVISEFGGLDIMVHCAAYTGATQFPGWAVSFERQTVEAWDAAIRVNVTSAFIAVQEAKDALAMSGHGSVIFFSSIYGMMGPDMRLYENTHLGHPAAYASSKGGLIQLSRWLATVLAPNVRVNAISPGGVWRDQPKEFHKRYVSRTPLSRMATEEDLKGAIAYLASDLSAYVTGHNLIVDGGWTAW